MEKKKFNDLIKNKLRKINLSNGCGFLIDKYDEIIKYLFVLDSEQLTGAKIPQVLFL
jgi:hypothetical protein